MYIGSSAVQVPGSPGGPGCAPADKAAAAHSRGKRLDTLARAGGKQVPGVSGIGDMGVLYVVLIGLRVMSCRREGGDRDQGPPGPGTACASPVSEPCLRSLPGRPARPRPLVPPRELAS